MTRTDDGLMIPVSTATGQPAFTIYRSFDDQRRYRIEPDGARRGLVLYGLDRAATTVLQSGTLLLVEGFSDALACVQWGIPNTAALLSAKPTAVQLRLARLYARQLVLWSDGDPPGEKVARLLAEHGDPDLLTVVVDGLDPAEALARQPRVPVLRSFMRYFADYGFVKLTPAFGLIEARERS